MKILDPDWLKIATGKKEMNAKKYLAFVKTKLRHFD
jgi:hypothetical protein